MSDPPGSQPLPLVMSPTIVNGLLCSILKALTRNPDRKELATVIDKDMSENFIEEACHIFQ